MKKSKKIIISVIISLIIIIAIVVAVAVTLYFRNKAIEEEKLNIAIKTVAEVSEENLEIDYTPDYTNKDVILTLTTSSEDSIMYRIETIQEDEETTEQSVEENIEYEKYEEPITISENSNVFIKYVNSYGTYSKEEYMITINNIDKEIPTVTKKDITATTNTVKVDVEATDNIEITKIEVSIDNENYNEVTDNSYTFESLQEGTEYTVKIRVTDKAGNICEDEVKTTTKVTPKKETTNNNTKKPTNSSSKNSGSGTTSTTQPSTSSTGSGELSQSEKDAQARVIAKQIASQCTEGTQLERVEKASSIVYGYYARGVHKETGTDYRTAYGVFIKGEASCAGCCRALGMVLSEMGISYKHINENQWTHQWLELTMDGQPGWADANVGLAGYGEYPFM